MMRRLVVLPLAALLLLALAGSGASAGASSVQIGGVEKFVPNALINSTFHFAPGPLTVASGDTVTWANATPDPHSITLVSASDLPTSLDAVFACQAPGGACFPALIGQFPDSGNPGLDTVGDSLLVSGSSLAVVVSA